MTRNQKQKIKKVRTAEENEIRDFERTNKIFHQNYNRQTESRQNAVTTNPRQRVRNSFRCGLCLFYGCIVLTYLHIVAQAFI